MTLLLVYLSVHAIGSSVVTWMAMREMVDLGGFDA